ncbi:MAG: hypothetical protein KGN31_02180 [Betaproteobacteria bacterium]|nr:hypothetical protein [Betaproteobacteria bacterium]
MKTETKEQLTLNKALDALQKTTGIEIEINKQQDVKSGLLTLRVAGRRLTYFVIVKSIVDRFNMLISVQKLNENKTPVLLIAPYISKNMAEHCRQLGISFIDEAGNVFINTQDVFVYVIGQPRQNHSKDLPQYTALTNAGLRIVFALLNRDKLISLPYRQIAMYAQVALGTVGPALKDLENRGYIGFDKLGVRRLINQEKLIREWTTYFPNKIRNKLNLRRFTSTNEDWFHEINIERYGAYWGGEVAVEKLTGYLKPSTVTIYTTKNPHELIIDNKLRPDNNGNIEILESFWGSGIDLFQRDLVPILLVYADLLATDNPRNIETAELIYERYFTSL